MKKKLTSLALVGAFLGLSWYGNVQAQESSGNKIHFINVQEGGSDAIILESNGHFAMVDTGEDYDFPDGSDSRYPWREGIETSYKHVLTDRVFRRLKELGVQKLDFILVTHTHSDHIGNVDELLSTYPVDRVYLKKYSDNRITNSERLWDNLYGYDKVLQTAAETSGAWLVDVSIEKSATIKTTSHSEIKESKEVVKKDLENKETSQHESVTNSSTSQDLTSSTSQSSETSVNKSESEQ